MSSERKYVADPGIGRDDAPIGSEQWAQAVRLHLQTAVKDLDWEPQRVKRYYALVAKHRAWSLMNKPDGSYFATWEEFCAHPQPWGLGKPWEEIRPFIEAVEGKVKTAAYTASAAPKPGGKRKGAGRPADTVIVETDDGVKVVPNPRTSAPNPRGNQRSDTNDEKSRGETSDYLAARIARDAPAVHEEMKAGKFPSVRAAAKAAGIVKDPDPVTVAARSIGKVPFHRLAELVAALPEQTRKALRMMLTEGAS